MCPVIFNALLNVGILHKVSAGVMWLIGESREDGDL